MAKITHFAVTINRDFATKFKSSVLEAIEDAASVAAQAAKSMAPYDPKSRKVRGLRPKWGNQHHRDTIIYGKCKYEKRQQRIGFGIDFDWDSQYYVKSGSGMGYWLEKGTKSNERKYSRQQRTYRSRMSVLEKYGLQPTDEMRKTMSRGEKRTLSNIRKTLARVGDIVDFKLAGYHAATPARPHFIPALKIAQRYLAARLQNIV